MFFYLVIHLVFGCARCLLVIDFLIVGQSRVRCRCAIVPVSGTGGPRCLLTGPDNLSYFWEIGFRRRLVYESLIVFHRGSSQAETYTAVFRITVMRCIQQGEVVISD